MESPSLSKIKIIIIIISALIFSVNLDSFIINVNIASYILFFAITTVFIGNINHLITLFISIYPIKSLFPAESNQIFQIIQSDEILILFIIGLYLVKKNENVVFNFDKNYYSNIAIYFSVFMFIVAILSHFRSVFILQSVQLSSFYYMKVTLKALLLTSAIILIARMSSNINTQKSIDRGLFIGTLLSSTVALLAPYVQNFGLNVSIYRDEVFRTGGAGMDANEFAAFMLLTMSYFFARIEQSKFSEKKYFIGVIFSLIGVLKSGSRTGLFIFLVLTLLFLIKNKNNVRQLIPLFMLFSFLSIFISAPAIDRLSTAGRHLQIDSGTGRLYRQYTTIKYLINNPSALLFGEDKSIQDATEIKTNAHNYYIYLLYKFGIFVFLSYLFIMIKLIILNRNKNKYSFSINYSLIAFYTPLLTVLYSTYLYFPLIIAMAPNKLSTKNNRD